MRRAASLALVLVWACALAHHPHPAPTDDDLSEERDEGCVMELWCGECLPEHMPLVTSPALPPAPRPRAPLRLAEGARVSLACARGKFLAYPLHGEVRAACEAGRYRVAHDQALRSLLDLGCQEDVFEDVLHPVEGCAPPLQGRAYVTGARHLAEVCFDAEVGVARWARAPLSGPLRLPAHQHPPRAPLTLLGNFEHMFDAHSRAAADRLYSDAGRLTRTLHALLRPHSVALGGLTLAPARLLAEDYFEGQAVRAAWFASNTVGAWGSVAAGNLRHVQRDVSELSAAARARNLTLEVYAGAHGVLSLGGRALFLHGGRLPVPALLWTLVVAGSRALAVLVVNNPLVSVEEAGAVMCGECAGAAWARRVARDGRAGRGALGLARCCGAHELAAAGVSLPAELLARVARGPAGMLLHLDEGAAAGSRQ